MSIKPVSVSLCAAMMSKLQEAIEATRKKALTHAPTRESEREDPRVVYLRNLIHQKIWLPIEAKLYKGLRYPALRYQVPIILQLY